MTNHMYVLNYIIQCQLLFDDVCIHGGEIYVPELFYCEQKSSYMN